MKTTNRFWQAHAATVVALLVLLTGCLGKESGVVPVHGVVLLDGAPLPRGTISFVPEVGRSSTGLIGPDGTFELQTSGKSNGAVPGKYRVAIVAFDGPLLEDGAARSLIPKRYGAPATSGLEFEVNGDGENEAKFELKSDAKPKR